MSPDDRTLTDADLDAIAERVAQRLRRDGVEPPKVQLDELRLEQARRDRGDPDRLFLGFVRKLSKIDPPPDPRGGF